MFISFAILWLCSPVILLVLFLVQLSKTSELKRQNMELHEKIRLLTEGHQQPDAADASEASGQVQSVSVPAPIPGSVPAPAPESVSAPAPESVSAPGSVPVSNADSSAKSIPAPLPYDMPGYIRPGYAVKPDSKIFSDNADKPQENTEISGEFTVPANDPDKKSVSTINIILILGALLISLAGFIFASAAWGIMNMFARTAILLSFSAVFFGIHSLAERKLKLVQTGRIFYILGSIFLPAAIAAAGILNVFGEYFSFSGEGRAAIFAMMFFSVCVPFFKGAHDYKFRGFAAVSFISFSASVVSLIWQLSPSGDITALASAVFALIVILTEPAVNKLFVSIFGEECVFVPEWKRFSSINAWALSIISLFAADVGFVSLTAFVIFSVCFLRKSAADSNGTAGTLAFAFFITAALFTGFEPEKISGFTAIIAATSLIYVTLSAMGIFPGAIRKIMRILAIIAAGIAAFLGIIENIYIIAENEIPSLSLIFAAAAVYAQLLILTLRNKTAEYKAMSFGAMLWLSAEIMLLISGKLGGSSYTFAAAYAFMLIYFAVSRFTKLKGTLYSSANDIIMAVYAFICAEICAVDPFSVYGGITGMAILTAGIILSAFSRQEKFSRIICPVLTAMSFFPLMEIFTFTDIIPPDSKVVTSAAGTVIILLCAAASVMLFIPKAREYAVSYGITAVLTVPLFIIISLMEGTSDFVPMLTVTVYTVVYLFKYAFPKGKYSHIDILFTAIILTTFFVGGTFTRTVYWVCFPAAALLLIFSVHIISLSMGGFEKIGKHSEKFLWFVMPIFSGIFIILAEARDCLPIMIFGAVLLLCTVFMSMFRKNTMNLIFPLFTAFAALTRHHEWDNGTAAAVTSVILAVTGRLMFSKKLFEKLYSDVFSISSIAFACIFIAEGDSELKRWIGLLLLAAAIANLIRKKHSVKTNRILLTAMSAFIFPVWWSQPFFDIPSLIELEWNLLPAVIFCVILRLTWRDSPEGAYNFSFVTAIVCLAVLFIGALVSGESFDSVFIGIVLLIMLAVSFIIKRKRWFVLAVASMVISAALLSLRQLDSIAWLVYLALTGAALIALGVVNEIKKQQKRSGEETKLTRFMSDWTW